MFPELELNQRCCYWGAPVPDGYGGFNWADPVELVCRWVDRFEAIIGPRGTNIGSRAQVQVTQDVELEGMLLLGTLDDLDSDVYNDPVGAGASVIIRFDKTPTIEADNFYRKVYLS